MKEDLNKPTMEAISFEIEYNRNVVRSCLYDLDTWVADEFVEKNLVTLLDTEGMPNAQAYTGILKMRQIYLKLYQRKLMAAGCSYVDYARFQKTLQKI